MPSKRNKQERVSLVCLNCEHTFEAEPRTKQGTPRLFCSTACRTYWWNDQRTRTPLCPHCGGHMPVSQEVYNMGNLSKRFTGSGPGGQPQVKPKPGLHPQYSKEYKVQLRRGRVAARSARTADITERARRAHEARKAVIFKYRPDLTETVNKMDAAAVLEAMPGWLLNTNWKG
jgi:hypothetical protein